MMWSILLLQHCAPSQASANALLQDTPFPLFDQVKAEHVMPGIIKLIEDLNAELDELEKTVQPTWSSLVEPLERLTDSISRAWSTVSHLKVLVTFCCM